MRAPFSWPSSYAGRPKLHLHASFSDGRIIMPGQQDRSRQQPGRIIMPGNMQTSNPVSQPGQNFTNKIGQEIAGSTTAAPPRNFRPPTGFMNESGPEEDIYSGKSADELIMLLSTRSDHWFNLAKAFPKLYLAGHDRAGLEEIANVDPSRQNIWSVAAEVFHSLKEELTHEQQAFFHNEESGPDCLMELRFLDSERRVEGARYIADERLAPDMALVLARAIKEHQRRGEAKSGFSNTAADCLAFKYYRDAQECRNTTERQQHIERGLSVAVTPSAVERLQELQEEPARKLKVQDAPVATLEVARLNKDEVGARPIPVVGNYGDVSAMELASTSQLGGNGAFQLMNMPAEGGAAVILPRWNILALAGKPAALFLPNVEDVPEMLHGKSTTYKGQGLLIVDAAETNADDSCFFLADAGNGKVKLVAGSEVQAPLAKALIVCMPPRQTSLTPDAFDI